MHLRKIFLEEEFEDAGFTAFDFVSDSFEGSATFAVICVFELACIVKDVVDGAVWGRTSSRHEFGFNFSIP